MAQIYVTALLEQAAHTAVGQLWSLHRDSVKLDLSITDRQFDALRSEIEARMPGQWNRATSADRRLYMYRRIT